MTNDSVRRAGHSACEGVHLHVDVFLLQHEHPEKTEERYAVQPAPEACDRDDRRIRSSLNVPALAHADEPAGRDLLGELSSGQTGIGKDPGAE